MSSIDTYNYLDELFPAKPNERATAKKTLDKDDFLQLFITQLLHQNPLEPLSNDQFIAQMSQFTAVEQATNTATTVAKLLTAQEENNELLAMLLYQQVGSVSRLMYESSSLIGKTVIARKDEDSVPVQSKVISVVLNSGDVEVYLANGQSFFLEDILEISAG